MNIINPYIVEAMASVGCGAADTRKIARILDDMRVEKWDILDGWRNFGFNLGVKEAYKKDAAELKQIYSQDDLICLAEYVNASRSVGLATAK